MSAKKRSEKPVPGGSTVDAILRKLDLTERANAILRLCDLYEAVHALGVLSDRLARGECPVLDEADAFQQLLLLHGPGGRSLTREEFIAKHMTEVSAAQQRCFQEIDELEGGGVVLPDPAVAGALRAARDKEDIRDGFRFPPDQVFFMDCDLDLPAGRTVDTFKALWQKWGECVVFKALDEESLDKEASDHLRGIVSKINGALRRHNVPCEVGSIRASGYVMRKSARA